MCHTPVHRGGEWSVYVSAGWVAVETCEYVVSKGICFGLGDRGAGRLAGERFDDDLLAQTLLNRTSTGLAGLGIGWYRRIATTGAGVI